MFLLKVPCCFRPSLLGQQWYTERLPPFLTHTKLPISVAALMSDESCEEVATNDLTLDRQAKQLGSTLRVPFMTLSFMALLVIPDLKLSDQGLFDVERFAFQPLFEDA